jgi:hypothetical protein
MRNLAGRTDCDVYIREELSRARIPIVPHPEPGKDEVPASIMGKLGAFTFQRSWYYWIVNGPLPIGAARAIYADPEGKATVRAAGHGGCVDPDEWARWEDADGNFLEVDEDGSREASAKDFDARYGIDDAGVRYVKSLDEVPDRRGIIDCYHIDDQAGLRLFADTLVAFHLDD